MPFLTEISLPLQSARDVTLQLDPLVASDAGYCLKTWMATRPDLSCRPWTASLTPQRARISGWRRTAPARKDDSISLGSRHVSMKRGERLALEGRFVPLRRCGSSRSSRDAAQGRTQPAGAYEAWLRERLVDLMPFATIDDVVIGSFSTRRVLRKVSHDPANCRVREELIPVVDATILLTILAPAHVEEWMLSGLGPQKAFGYGAFLPTLDPRDGA